MAISTNGTIITRLAGALYGEYLSNASYTELASTAPATVAANFMTNDFAGKTDLQVANTILTNLGLTSITGLNNWLAAQLTAAGSTAAAKGAALVSILNSYAGMTADATYGTYAVGFNAKVDASLALSQTAGSKGGAFDTSDVVVATAQTFSLTTGTNAFTGSTGNDTFDAGLSTSSLQTLNSGDRLDGGAGTDELIAVVNTAVTPTLVTGIENVTITGTAAIAVDFANATGIQNLTNQSSTAGLILSGFGKATNVTVRDTNQATQVVTFSDVSGTADSATINVQNLTGSASLTVAGVETLTLNSLGSVSNVVGLSATSTKTLNVTGPAGVTLGTLGSTVNKVDASASTGTLANGVSLTTGATGATTIIGAAGNDAFTLGASTGADSVSGGDGNDAITFTANFTTADTVDGGAGTTDSLTLFTVTDAVTASASTPTTYSVTGIETITVGGVGATYGTGLAANGSITVANISATATTLNIATTGATATYDVLVGAGTVVGPAGSFTLGLGGSVASNTAKLLGALTVTDTGAGTADSITIRNNAATGSGTANYSVWNGQNIVSSGYETVTLTSGSTAGGVANAFGTVTVTGDIGGTTAETVNFSGANIVTVGVISADIVDASALTASGTSAAPTITMTTGSTATKVTGSAGIDVLFGSSSSSSVYGGAGNDTINGGAGNDALFGETGDDTLIGSTGNDSIDGGTGNDRVETGSGLAAGDTIVGGDGVDTLAITSDVTDDASGMSAVSGFEVLEVASAGSDTITMSNFTNSQTFTRVDFSQLGGGTGTVNNVPASVTDVRILAGAIADTLVFDRLIDNSTNEVTISSRTGAATAITLLTANDEETIHFSGLTASDDLTLTNLNAADLKTLNITGDADFVVTAANAISSTLLATLDASTSTGAVTVTNSSNAVKATVTGGSGILTYVGGAAADSISGGSAADVLDGGNGADTINGNAGNDSITGGLGADVINVGSGTDTFNLGSGNGLVATSTSVGTAAVTITNIAITGSDVITGMGVGDKITFGTNTAAAFDGIDAVTVGKIATAVLMTDTTVDNSANLMRGSWIADSTTGSGTFIYNTAGADMMYTYDSNPTVGTLAFKSVILVGVGGVVTGGAHAHAGGVITMTLS